MNWDAAGAIGEIMGALVVVVTLIYVARQLKLHATATISETMGSWQADYNVLVLEMFKDRAAAEIVRRGLTDFESMDGNDKMRFHAWMIMLLLNSQNIFFQREDAVMHQRLAEMQLSFNAATLSTKGGNQWWASVRSVMDPVFVEDMEGRIGRASPVTDAMPWFALQADEIGN
jgi:hypothetical protein